MRNYVNKNILGILIFVTACGGGGGSKAPEGPTIEQREQDLDVDGQFMAPFTTINQLQSGLITGSATLAREKSKLYADVRFNGLHGDLIKPQYVHEGSRCPTILQDDTNQDGIIDAVEGHAVYGNVLIPLDADLSSQDRGSSYFTMTNPYGFYEYHQMTSYDRFIKDMTEVDQDEDDDFIKLTDEKSLNLGTRVVVIYGVPKETLLPPTVARRGRLANFQTLPIACGVLSPVITVPGTVDTDAGVDLPAEGSTVGGSGGADDGTVVVLGRDLPTTTGGVDGRPPEDNTPAPTDNGSTGGTTGGTIEPMPTEPPATDTLPTDTLPTDLPPEPSETSGGTFGL